MRGYMDKCNTNIYLDVHRDGDALSFLVKVMVGPGEWSRFWLRPGCRLSQKEEAQLVGACRKGIGPGNIEDAAERISKVMPELHLCFYPDHPEHTVLHLYYALFPGVREMLFKANLNFLAASVDSMEGIDMQASSPVKLFDGLTMKALRLLNTEWGVRELADKRRRQLSAKTYRSYYRWLGGVDHISLSLWRYLKDCERGTAVFKHLLMKMMNHDDPDSGSLYDEYLLYQVKAKIIDNNRYCPAVFTEEQLARYSARADMIIEIRHNKKILDRRLRAASGLLSGLDYADEHFIVRHPETVEDIIEEAVGQSNCLMSMASGIAKGWYVVGFMRKAEAPDQSFVTFQVRDGHIIQICGKYNRMLSKRSKEYKWFKEYTEKKGFDIRLEWPAPIVPGRDEEDIPFA